jgi:hypothetical protein
MSTGCSKKPKKDRILMRHNQLLFYANKTNLLSENVYAIRRNAETLFVPAKEPGLEVAAKKINHILLSYQQ